MRASAKQDAPKVEVTKGRDAYLSQVEREWHTGTGTALLYTTDSVTTRGGWTMTCGPQSNAVYTNAATILTPTQGNT